MRPDESYLIAVGWANYLFQYLEWGVIEILSKITGRDVSDVEYGTPRSIANDLTSASKDYPITSAWAEDYSGFIAFREHLVHSRPATIDGKQMLYRHEVKRYNGGTFPLTLEWLKEFAECAKELSDIYYEALKEVNGRQR